MTTFEIPTLTTDRLRLRAFRASDLDGYVAMQANPEVMRYLITGRTSPPVEVWRTMATSLGHWALRGYHTSRRVANGSERSANAYANCVVLPTNIGSTTGPGAPKLYFVASRLTGGGVRPVIPNGISTHSIVFGGALRQRRDGLRLITMNPIF